MTTWEFRVKRTGHLFPFYLYLIGQQRIDRLFNIPFKYKNLKWVDYELYYSEEENQEFMKIIKDKLLHDPEHLKKIVADNIKQAEKLNSFIMKIREMRLNEVSEPELENIFKEYIELQIDFYGFWAISVPASRVVEILVKEEIAKKTDKVEEYFESFTYPSRELELVKEQLFLFKIGAEIEEKYPKLLNKNPKEIIEALDEELKQKLIKHKERFEWMNSTYHINFPCVIEDFIKRLKEKSNYAKLVKDVEKKNKEIEQKISKNIKELGLDEKSISLINSMRDFVFLRNFEKENANKNQYLVEPLIVELARRLKVDREDILTMSYEEIIEALEGELIPQTELAARKKRFGIIIKDSKAIIVSGLDVEDYKEKKVIEKVDEIQGRTACAGYAKGIVKVVHSKNEISKVQKGDILVASMTTPDYVPAMERAAAFVTDEGGITCHAAIVSREMNTPCITGTKIATKVLKDGDLVEVDADKGIVRKI